MPELKRIRVYYEGDDDRNLLEVVQGASLIPASWDIAKRSKNHPGKEGMVHELAAFIRPVNGVGGTAVVLVDLDDLSADRVLLWFQKCLEQELPSGEPKTVMSSPVRINPRTTLFELSGPDRQGRAVLIAVGLSDDENLKTTYTLVRFAVDDYLLRLVGEPRVYGQVSDFRDVPIEKALHKLMEFAQLLRNNGLPVEHSKRFLHLLRAITGFRPSSAVFVQRVAGKACEVLAKEELRPLLAPLIDDLDQAAKALSHQPTP